MNVTSFSQQLKKIPHKFDETSTKLREMRLGSRVPLKTYCNRLLHVVVVMRRGGCVVAAADGEGIRSMCRPCNFPDAISRSPAVVSDHRDYPHVATPSRRRTSRKPALRLPSSAQ